MKKYIVLLTMVMGLVGCSDSDRKVAIYPNKSIPTAQDLCKSHGGLDQLLIKSRTEGMYESCGYKCSKLVAELVTFTAVCTDKFRASYALDVLDMTK